MGQMVVHGVGHNPGDRPELVKALLPEGSERLFGDSVSPWEDHPGWVIEEGGDDFDLPGLLEEEEAAAWLFDSAALGAGR